MGIDNNNNPDFYYENGLVVFTKEYHLKRGYCCKNGCKNCPYKLKANATTKSKKDTIFKDTTTN